MRSHKILIHDLLLFAVTAYTALLIRENLALTWDHVTGLVPYVLIGMPTAVASFLLLGANKGLWRHVSTADTIRISGSVLIAVAVSMFLMFAFNRLDGLSRSVALLHVPLLVAAMLGSRYLVRKFYGDGVRWQPAASQGKRTVRENVLIVGVSHVAELYLQCVNSMASDRIQVEGILDENPDVQGRLINFTEVVGKPQDLASVMSMFNVHGVRINRVVVTAPFMSLSEKSREALLRMERSGTIELDMFEERLGFKKFVDEPDEAAPAVAAADFPEFTQPSQNLLDRYYPVLKRIFDIVGASVLAILCLPLYFIVALLVAYDVGTPVIFWQERPGRHGKLFRLLKFRTMRSGHDRHGNIIPDEKRTSKLGYLLRSLRMDELPQLYHIFIGEMSFVGPRPLLSSLQPADTAARLSVRPGVTGWAQLNGGNIIGAEEKRVLDMWYLRRANLWLDIKIVFMTLLVTARGRSDELDPRSRAAIRMAQMEERMLSQQPQRQTAREREDVRQDVIGRDLSPTGHAA